MDIAGLPATPERLSLWITLWTTKALWKRSPRRWRLVTLFPLVGKGSGRLEPWFHVKHEHRHLWITWLSLWIEP